VTKSADETPKGALILYQTEDGRTRIECRFEGDTVWLTQAMLAELFQTTPQNITQHLREIYVEAELDEAATCKPFLQVRTEGARQVSRKLHFYNLEAILAVGFRVRSHRGTQFRKWANARLSEYLVKGFTMDDERLKNPPGPGHTDYFDELLERIRDIRASERRFYQKVLDIYATSIDYQPDTEDDEGAACSVGAHRSARPFSEGRVAKAGDCARQWRRQDAWGGDTDHRRCKGNAHHARENRCRLLSFPPTRRARCRAGCPQGLPEAAQREHRCACRCCTRRSYLRVHAPIP